MKVVIFNSSDFPTYLLFKQVYSIESFINLGSFFIRMYVYVYMYICVHFILFISNNHLSSLVILSIFTIPLKSINQFLVSSSRLTNMYSLMLHLFIINLQFLVTCSPILNSSLFSIPFLILSISLLI